ncbi:hypothetical protein JW935_05705 [candidate division KSB1 bacterium]|nr:hypothetical protein [candidate division KSB1 bacterium]
MSHIYQKVRNLRAAWFLLILAASVPVQTKTISIHRCATKPKIDGEPSDFAWQAGLRITGFFQFDPQQYQHRF